MKIGARNGVRSLIIAGLTLYMSLALLMLILFMVLVVSSSVMGLSWKGGCLLGSCCMLSTVMCGGMVWLVLCPMVMKWSLRAFAMSLGSVYVWFSYVIDVGEDLFGLFDGRIDFRILACFLWSFLVSCSCWFRCFFLAALTSLLTLFLCFLWFWMFLFVGCFILSW